MEIVWYATLAVIYLLVGDWLARNWYVPEAWKLASENRLDASVVGVEEARRSDKEAAHSIIEARILMTVGWFPFSFVECGLNFPVLRMMF